MLNLAIHDWKDALAATFFVVVLPGFLILVFAAAFAEEFKRKGDWAQIKREIWEFNPDTFQESLYGIGFGGVMLSLIFASRFSLWAAFPLGFGAAFGIAALLTFICRVLLTFLVLFLERK